MEKVFISPSKYVQGNNVLKTGLKYIKNLGNNVLLLCDKNVWGIIGETFYNDLKIANFEVMHVEFNGESSQAEIDRIAKIGNATKFDTIIGLGGGKTCDTARGVSLILDIHVCIIPTTASTDAPTASLIAVYTEEGKVEKYLFTKSNPDLVLVDTKLLSQAPVRLFASGMADALATWVEASAVRQKDGTTTGGGRATLAGIAIAEKCEQVIFEYGVQAYEANCAKVVTRAFEYVVEANTLLSGIGYESGGLAAAHAIHNGLTVLPGRIHELTHGEKVAYGTLTQLFLEDRKKSDIDKFIAFYRRLNLPTTLKDLHLENATYEDLLKVGEASTISGETIHQMPFEVTAEDVANAILAVDSYVRHEFA